MTVITAVTIGEPAVPTTTRYIHLDIIYNIITYIYYGVFYTRNAVHIWGTIRVNIYIYIQV